VFLFRCAPIITQYILCIISQTAVCFKALSCRNSYKQITQICINVHGGIMSCSIFYQILVLIICGLRYLQICLEPVANKISQTCLIWDVRWMVLDGGNQTQREKERVTSMYTHSRRSLCSDQEKTEGLRREERERGREREKEDRASKIRLCRITINWLGRSTKAEKSL
jgi:hypothetical protein